MTQIRPITEFAELQRCVSLQQIVWGGDSSELVPASMLWVAHRTGGLVAGAYDTDDTLIGFVFGITGYVAKRPLHWSDMLAVHPRARGTGVGRELKRYQREVLLGRGITEVNWTFDPLESRNAHLNFHRLGATAREYLPDVYGTSSSHLHAGLSTDRLVARWLLDSERVRARMEGPEAPPPPAFDQAPIINAGGLDLELNEATVRLRIPNDIQTIKRADLSSAQRWRADTRAAFTAYFARGYEAVELVRGGDGFSDYILIRA